MFKLQQKWEDLDNLPFPASTTGNDGDALSFNGSGAVIPSTPGLPVVGFLGQTIATTDPDYALAKQIFYQKSGNVGEYRFEVPVGAGTALASMIGSTFNVYGSNPGQIDVSAYKTLTYNTLAVSTFTVGHTITGGTSAATGVITAVNTLPNGSQQLVYTVTSGTFVAGETITDGTSSATAKILALIPNGTQFKIENVLSTTLVEVSVALTA